MKKLIITLLTFITLLSGAGMANAWSTTLPACEHEDSINCAWDANVQGNGQGQSFINNDGVITYIPEMGAPAPVTEVAPTPVYADPAVPCPTVVVDYSTTQGLDAIAWDLFDATGANTLLPDYATTVTFTASADYQTPIAPTLDTIVVTDMLGNTYQFTIS